MCLFRRFARANPENAFIRIMDVDENAWYEDDDGVRYHGSALRRIGLPAVFPNGGDASSRIFHLHRKKK